MLELSKSRNLDDATRLFALPGTGMAFDLECPSSRADAARIAGISGVEHHRVGQCATVIEERRKARVDKVGCLA